VQSGEQMVAYSPPFAVRSGEYGLRHGRLRPDARWGFGAVLGRGSGGARLGASVRAGAAVPVQLSAQLPVHAYDGIIEIPAAQLERLALPQAQRERDQPLGAVAPLRS
jgi:hypothetical protein